MESFPGRGGKLLSEKKLERFSARLLLGKESKCERLQSLVLFMGKMVLEGKHGSQVQCSVQFWERIMEDNP